jgi:hypothetical protein
MIATSSREMPVIGFRVKGHIDDDMGTILIGGRDRRAANETTSDLRSDFSRGSLFPSRHVLWQRRTHPLRSFSHEAMMLPAFQSARSQSIGTNHMTDDSQAL